jgi:hypothetical protein
VLRKSEGLRIRTRGLSMHPWLKYIFPFHRTYAGVVTTGCAALRNLRLGVFFARRSKLHKLTSDAWSVPFSEHAQPHRTINLYEG